MTTLTATELFGESGVPLRAREFSIRCASDPVRAEAIKVVFSLAGWAELRSGEDRAIMRQGSIFTVPAFQRCYAIPVDHARSVVFYLHPEYLGEQLRWLPNGNPLLHHLRRSVNGIEHLQHLQVPPAAVQSLLPHLLHLARTPHRSDQELMRLTLAGTVLDTVGRFAGLRCAEAEECLPNLAAPRPEVAAAVSLMHHQVDRDWSAGDLASRVALSPSQLTRLFRSHVGMSPARYLWCLRADHMAELLATTGRSVGEAARAVGWSNPAVASRAFKRRYGISPRQFAATIGVYPSPLTADAPLLS